MFIEDRTKMKIPVKILTDKFLEWFYDKDNFYPCDMRDLVKNGCKPLVERITDSKSLFHLDFGLGFLPERFVTNRIEIKREYPEFFYDEEYDGEGYEFKIEWVNEEEPEVITKKKKKKK